MKKLILILSIIIFVLNFFSCKNEKDSTKLNVEVSESMKITRGKYLVTVSGCNDCHSPKIMTEHGPQPDPERLLSGHPANTPEPDYDAVTTSNWVLFNFNNTMAIGPWGTSYSANITSDATGIGNWSEEQFFEAMRHGKYKGLAGSRMLLPPMPWPNYAAMTDADLKAVFAYLKSTKPVNNVVPAPKPPITN